MARRSAGKTAASSFHLIYRRLLQAFGPQGWWPADGPFEMMVGAILTQATNWHNVERALDRLTAARTLTPRALAAMRRARLERLIRPAGYFRQKAARLQRFSRWYLARYGGSPRRMFRVPWRRLRGQLLTLHGIGPETADAMLLYAGGRPVFVVDAYTMRVFRRHRLIAERATYDDVQRAAMRSLPDVARLYNEFHALLVAVGKRHCHRRTPDCTRCPLGNLPHTTR